jgi:hypothetical protein
VGEGKIDKDVEGMTSCLGIGFWRTSLGLCEYDFVFIVGCDGGGAVEIGAVWIGGL